VVPIAAAISMLNRVVNVAVVTGDTSVVGCAILRRGV
jgi:hypothetical protein